MGLYEKLRKDPAGQPQGLWGIIKRIKNDKQKWLRDGQGHNSG